MADNPHIPQKFLRDYLPDVRTIVQRETSRTEPILQSELQTVLERVFDRISEPLRQNWLEIERWAQRNPSAPSASDAFDAYVSLDIDVDSPSTRTFTTPYRAIEFVANTLGLEVARIGLLPRETGGTGESRFIETSNLATLDSSDVRIEIVGLGLPVNTNYSPSDSASGTQWDLADTTWGSTIPQIVVLRNVYMFRGTGSKTWLFGTSAASQSGVRAYNCILQGAGNTDLPGTTFLNETNVLNARFTTTGMQTWFNSRLSFVSGQSFTSAANIRAWDCVFETSTSNTTITFNTASRSFYFFNCTLAATGNADIVMAFTSTQTCEFVFIGGAEDPLENQNAAFSITNSAGLKWAHIDGGNWATLTLAAPESTSQALPHRVRGLQVGTWDITGPAFVEAWALIGPALAVTIRGPRNFVNLSGDISNSSGTYLVCDGMSDSHVLLRANFGNAAVVPYNIHADSSDSIIFPELSGTHDTPVNASSSVLVIDHNGVAPSGAAGGDLAGTYPNPTVDGLLGNAFNPTSLTATEDTFVPQYNDATGEIDWVAPDTIGVTDHGALTGLADDDHTQYALLAGRATGQTLSGGNAAGENLNLSSTSHGTKGSIIFGTTSRYDEANLAWLFGHTSLGTEALRLRGSLLTVLNTDVARRSALLFDNSININAGVGTGNTVALLRIAPTVDVNAEIDSINGIEIDGDISIDATGITSSFGVVASNRYIGTQAPGIIQALQLICRLSPDSAVTYPLAIGMLGGVFSLNNNVTVTEGIGVRAFVAEFFGLGTITTGYGFQARNTDLSITTNKIGLEVERLTGASTINLGIRNAGSTAFTAFTKTITAVGNSISVVSTDAATFIQLNNTSGGALTLTSTPTITDGQSGQLLIIENQSTSAVTFQRNSALAGSNLRLGAASRTLNQFDILTLIYDAVNSEWVEISFVDNT